MTELEARYTERYNEVLVPLARDLEAYLKNLLSDSERIDRVCARAKTVGRFVAKAEKIDNGVRKYTDPLNQIQDQVGARVVTFYLSDIDLLSKTVESYFRPIEFRTIVPDSDYEFTYFGRHYILLLPSDVVRKESCGILPFFELQLKTLFQHAWSEANHDLGYKPEKDLSSDNKRKIAFTSAQAWGADQMFNELHREIGTIRD